MTGRQRLLFAIGVAGIILGVWNIVAFTTWIGIAMVILWAAWLANAAYQARKAEDSEPAA